MSTYTFGEQSAEYSAKHGKELPVYQTPKYKEAKKKAIEIIDSGKYEISEADFWILMNTTKNEKMAYTGLIISHNGCLKINDHIETKFSPSSVTLDKEGYGGSLVYTYCNEQQGIYEVGEVSNKNCQNAYPYAMAYKRLFDRVVLKLSKLAYSGILSDSESEEFTNPQNESKDATDVLKALNELIELGKRAGVQDPAASLCKRYNLAGIADITEEQYNEAKAGFTAAVGGANG